MTALQSLCDINKELDSDNDFHSGFVNQNNTLSFHNHSHSENQILWSSEETVQRPSYYKYRAYILFPVLLLLEMI